MSTYFTIKDTTIDRIRNIIGDGDESLEIIKLVTDDRWLSLYRNHMNEFEKNYSQQIISLIYDGLDNLAIKRKIMEETIMGKKKEKSHKMTQEEMANIVDDESERLFKEQNEMYLDGGVDVTIGGFDFDDDEGEEPILITSDVTLAKKDKKKKKKHHTEDKSDRYSVSGDIVELIANRTLNITDFIVESFNKAIIAAEYGDDDEEYEEAV